MTNLAHNNQDAPKACIEMAQAYIEALTGSRDTPMSFTLLDDKKRKSNKPRFVYGSMGACADKLASLNAAGYAVFIAVNRLKAGKDVKRNANNIEGLRALFSEQDGEVKREPMLAPSFIVQSARGPHTYWVLSEGEPLSMFGLAQEQLAAYFDSDHTVTDLPRLMRVPGFFHHKGAPVMVTFVPGSGERHTISEVLRAHPVTHDELQTFRKQRNKRRAPAGHAGAVEAVVPVGDLPAMETRKKRAVAYLQRVPPAVEGQGGDNHTYNIACCVVTDFAVDTLHDAMEILRPWNSSCCPPWEETDLEAKIKSAMANSRGPLGSKLTAADPAAVAMATRIKPGMQGDALYDAAESNTGDDHRDGSDSGIDVANDDTCVANEDAAGLAGSQDEGDDHADFMEMAATAAAAGEDEPFHLRLLGMLAEDRTQALDDQVIDALARLAKDDEEEYTRCLDEIRDTGPGVLQRVKVAVKKRRIALSEQAVEASMTKAKRPVVEAVPAAACVIDGSHEVPFGYEVTPYAIFKLAEKKGEGGEKILVHIPVCDRPLVITALLQKVDGSGSSLELAFPDKRTGTWKKVIAPRNVVLTSRLINDLALQGFPVNSGIAGLVVEYIAAYESANEKTLTVKIAAVQMGWQGEDRSLGFLVGRKLISPRGTTPKPIELMVESDGDALLAESFRAAGTFGKWQHGFLTVTEYPRVHMAVLASLAAPLLEPLGMQNHLYDISGETSTGKTTCLRIAAAVWGAPSHPKYSILRSWNTTAVGLERTASMLSGLPLFVDESNEAQTVMERATLAKLVYQLANGRGRTRGTKAGGVQPFRTWHTIVFSSGEAPITSLTQDAGTRARVVAIEDAPFGEQRDSTGPLVRHLDAVFSENYGHAGSFFVQYILDHLGDLDAWKARHAELAEGYATDPKVPVGVGQRLARYLALIDLTGELFAKAIDWPLGYESPVRDCLPSVMQSAQQADRWKDGLIEAVSATLVQPGRLFGEANYDPSLGYIGKRRLTLTSGEDCLAITREFARKALMNAGFNPVAMFKSWVKHDYTVPDSAGGPTRLCKFEGAPVRCVCVRQSVIERLMSDPE